MFVCEGNTRRTPLPELIARDMFGEPPARSLSAGLDVRESGGTVVCEEIPDPWGGDLETYRRLAIRITRLLGAWRPYLAVEPGEGESA